MLSCSLYGMFDFYINNPAMQEDCIVSGISVIHYKKEVSHITEYFPILLSISTLCQWFKLFYFLRILESTGFLVRAIVSCISDMRFFLLILLVFMLAFGDAYKVMSVSNEA